MTFATTPSSSSLSLSGSRWPFVLFPSSSSSSFSSFSWTCAAPQPYLSVAKSLYSRGVEKFQRENYFQMLNTFEGTFEGTKYKISFNVSSFQNEAHAHAPRTHIHRTTGAQKYHKSDVSERLSYFFEVHNMRGGDVNRHVGGRDLPFSLLSSPGVLRIREVHGPRAAAYAEPVFGSDALYRSRCCEVSHAVTGVDAGVNLSQTLLRNRVRIIGGSSPRRRL